MTAPDPPLTDAARDALVHQLHCADDGAYTALAALAPDAALEVLERAGFPQYVARAVATTGTRLRDALYRRAARLGPTARTTAVLAGLLALHRAAGTALEPQFDPWLADALRTWWADAVHAIWRDGLRALPFARREALVCPPGGEIAWRYLPDVPPSPAALARAVRLTAQSVGGPPRDIPAWYTPQVYALARVGDDAVPWIVSALAKPDAATTAWGRRVLTAALAWSSSRHGEDALRALHRADPDPLVRRLARDGLDARGIVPPRAHPAPDELARVAAARGRVTDALRQRALDGSAPPATEPLLAALALAEVWLRAVRTPDSSLAPGALIHRVSGAFAQLADTDAPLAAWCVADLACRIPPVQLGTFAAYDVLRSLPPALEHAAALALAACLSPDDCGNPVPLYDWLAAHRPAVPDHAPAFEHGLTADDPRVVRICARARGRAPAAPPPPARVTLDDLRAAFAPIHRGAYYGGFGLYAVDHRARAWLELDWHGDDGPPAAPSPAMLELAAAAPLPPDAMAERLLAALAPRGLAMPERLGSPGYEPVRRLTADGARAALVELICGDSAETTRSDAEALAAALFARFGDDPACTRLDGIAPAAWTVGLFVQDRAARFSALVAYINDQ